jgi:hypothetical protein
MPQGEWRLDAAYHNKNALDAPGFAFEYLRRNRDFVRDQRHLEQLLKRSRLTVSMRDAFADRWGMRFREVRAHFRKSGDPLDDDGPAQHRPADVCTACF